jgi:hypothetical protein
MKVFRTNIAEQLMGEFHQTPYKYIYISLGGKINEQIVHYDHPCIKLHTNALYQMIPTFIQELAYIRKVMIVIVDDFHNEYSLQNNIRQVQSFTNIMSNINVVFVDYKLNTKNCNQFIETILNTIPSEIKPDEFMICNYIRFRHPNEIEMSLEDSIPVCIQTQLQVYQKGRFSKRFYQWFGYMFYFHNYIYNYNTYLAQMFHMHQLYTLTHKVLNEIPLHCWNEDLVESSLLTKNNIQKWKQFKENTICLV